MMSLKKNILWIVIWYMKKVKDNKLIELKFMKYKKP